MRHYRTALPDPIGVLPNPGVSDASCCLHRRASRVRRHPPLPNRDCNLPAVGVYALLHAPRLHGATAVSHRNRRGLSARFARLPARARRRWPRSGGRRVRTGGRRTSGAAHQLTGHLPACAHAVLSADPALRPMPSNDSVPHAAGHLSASDTRRVPIPNPILSIRILSVGPGLRRRFRRLWRN